VGWCEAVGEAVGGGVGAIVAAAVAVADDAAPSVDVEGAVSVGIGGVGVGVSVVIGSIGACAARRGVLLEVEVAVAERPFENAQLPAVSSDK
jgi:hypothetical protein